MEKEWLLTNGIGGLANKTIIGAGSRMHSCYLTASINPPADRWLILANVWERVKISGREFDMACQEYM